MVILVCVSCATQPIWGGKDTQPGSHAGTRRVSSVLGQRRLGVSGAAGKAGGLPRPPSGLCCRRRVEREEGRVLNRIKRKPLAPDEIAAQRLFQQGIENSASMARTVVLR